VDLSSVLDAPGLPDQVRLPELRLDQAMPTRVLGVDVVALPVLATPDGPELGPGCAEAEDDLGLDLLAVLESLDGSGRAGEVLTVPLIRSDSVGTLLLVGVGDATPGSVRRAAAALARAVRGRDAVATSVHDVGGDDHLVAFVEGAVLGSFSFTFADGAGTPSSAARIVLAATPGTAAPALERGLVLARAGWLARTLATVPSNVKSPAWLADRAVAVADEAGLEVEVWDEQRLAAEGFGGIASVGRGSASPPRFVRLAYKPKKGARKAPHVALIGKGITFDTGGLSIKPGEAMVNMKRDMTGAAVVLAVLSGLAALGCPIRVTGLLCIAENAVGADAMRPGDVLRHYGGRTTEVVNTDAEGRLVMADGLAWAVANLDPDALVDVATLTGGIKVALGLQTGGIFGTDDTLANALRAAGDAAGEPLWRMPLVEEYADRLASPIADANNCPPSASAITAALFLRPFTGGLPWAHLDIASVGDAPEDRDEWTQGPTGFGPRLLLRWLSSDAPLAGVGR
jgi:leucyl aminopeptidase